MGEGAPSLQETQYAWVQRGQHQGKLFNILGLFFLCLA
jgi:hypothetical protein